jgi:hypothetical protein
MDVTRRENPTQTDLGIRLTEESVFRAAGIMPLELLDDAACFGGGEGFVRRIRLRGAEVVRKRYGDITVDFA